MAKEEGPLDDRLAERSKVGWVLGWVWMAFALLNLVDILRHPLERGSLLAGAVLLVVSAVVFAIGLRPRLDADPDRVRMRNPLRTVDVPWGAVDGVEARDTVRVVVGEKRYHAWVGHVANRRRSVTTRANLRMQAGDLGGTGYGTTADPHAKPLRTQAEYLADRLTVMSDKFARREREAGHTAVSVRWSWPTLAVLAASVVLLVLAILLP